MTNHWLVSVTISSFTSALFAYSYFKYQFSKQLEPGKSVEIITGCKLWFSIWYGLFTIYSAFIATPTGASVVILGPLFVGMAAGWRYGLLTSGFGVVATLVKAGLEYHSEVQFLAGNYFPTATAAVLAGLLAGLWHSRLNNKLPKIWQSTAMCIGFILAIELPLVLLFSNAGAITISGSWRFFGELIIATSAGMAMMIVVVNNLLQEQKALLETRRINGELSAVKAAQQLLVKTTAVNGDIVPNVNLVFGTVAAGKKGNAFFEHYYCADTRWLYFAVFTLSELSASATMAALVCKTFFRAKAKRAALLPEIISDLRYELAAVGADGKDSRWFAGIIAVDGGELIDTAVNNLYPFIRSDNGVARELRNSGATKTALLFGECLVVRNYGDITTTDASEGEALMMIGFRLPEETLTIAIDLQETEQLESWLANFIKQQALADKLAVVARLVLEELTVNIIKYGFPNGSSGHDKIEIRLRLEGGRLLIRVTDTGLAFNPLTIKAETPRQKNMVGGWGIKLVQRFAEKVDYEYRDGKNIISIEINAGK